MIGRHIESAPAGASRRYENPRDAYDDTIRHVVHADGLRDASAIDEMYNRGTPSAG